MSDKAEEAIDEKAERLGRDPSKGSGEVIFGVNDKYQVINTTESPDEMLSMCSFLMHITIDTIYQYSKNQCGPDDEPLDKRELREKLISAESLYNLTDAGMTPEEAMDVLKFKGKVYEVSKENTED